MLPDQTDPLANSLSWRLAAPYLLLLSAGLLLLLVGLTHEGVWLDEVYSARMATLPLLNFVLNLRHDVHPPLYYVLLWLFAAVGGPSIFTLRLFSVVAALALAALGAGPIRRACGAAVGLLYTVLVLITPGTLYEGQEARMYTLAAFFVSGCAVYAYLAGSTNTRGDWIKLGAFTLGAAYTHYYGLACALTIQALLLLWILLHRRTLLRTWLRAAGLAAVLYLPWLPFMVRQFSGHIASFWVSNISTEMIRKAVLAPFAYKRDWVEPIGSLPLLGAITILLVFGLIVALRRGRPERWLLLLSCATYALVLSFMVTFSYAVRPILTERYMIVLLGLILLPAAYGLAVLPRRTLTFAALAFLLFFAVPILRTIQSQLFNGPWPAVLSYLQANAPQDAAFIYGDLSVMSSIAYLYPDNDHLLYLAGAGSNFPRPFWGPGVLFGEDSGSLMSAHQTVFLVSCYTAPGCTIDDTWLAARGLVTVGAVETFAESFSGMINIVQVQQAGAAHSGARTQTDGN